MAKSLLLLSLSVCAYSSALAEPGAASGCPVFHCTPEATGVMKQPLIQQPLTFNINSALGTLKAQGCSGDGARLSCLFATDTTAGNGKGTLKVLDATTLQPIWGSLDAPNSFDLVMGSSAGGQVPFAFSNGQIAAGDAVNHVLYNAEGAMIGNLTLGGRGNNLGLTPISDLYGIVSQTDGVLTLVNMSTWQIVGVLVLRDPDTRAAVSLVSPSSATSNVLYAVGANAKNGRGYLFSVVVNPATNKLKVRSSFIFTGKSGASPVVVTPANSGQADNLILLHVPGLPGDAQPQSRLLGLADNGSTFTTAWIIQLAQRLPVSPTIDEVSQTLFYQFDSDTRIYQHSFLSGAQLNVFDIRAIGGLPSSFLLNGHLGASRSAAGFTMLLAGGVTTNPGSNGQYVLAFMPTESPSALTWMVRIRGRPDPYMAAWNLGPSSQPGAYCPIVVGPSSGITRICDF